MTPSYWKRATRELAAADPVLQALIGRFDGLPVGSRGDAFATLARAIVGQQLSVKAAQSVWHRLNAGLAALTPAAFLSTDVAQLRAWGLSGRKAIYLRALAQRFDSGTLDADSWASLDDDAVIGRLTQVKGIGRWTAEMFLIFYLMRPDVFPLDDLGLQRALRTCYNGGRPLPVARMRKMGRAWAPWRSVATWYLWRSLDPVLVRY